MIMKPLLIAAKIAGKNKIISITEGVCIKEGIATVTDLTTFFTFPVNIQGSGVVNFKLFKALYESKGFQEGIFTEKGLSIIVNGQCTDIPIDGDIDNFPATPSESMEGEVSLDSTLLVEAVDFCTKDEMRPAMTGVALSNGCVTASDGHVLYWQPYEGDIQGVIPAATVRTIPPKTNLKLSRGKVYMRIQAGECAWYSRLITQSFPDFKAVIPTTHGVEIEANYDEVKQALVDLKPFANKVTQMMKVKASADHIVLSTADTDFAIERTITLNGKSNKDITAAFSIGYLQRVMKPTKDRFSLKGSIPSKPFILNDNQLIMPVIIY